LAPANDHTALAGESVRRSASMEPDAGAMGERAANPWLSPLIEGSERSWLGLAQFFDDQPGSALLMRDQERQLARVLL